MINQEDIQHFTCQVSGRRYDLSAPFECDDKIVATDGHKIVVVNKDQYTGQVNHDAFVPDCRELVRFEFKKMRLRTLPVVEKPIGLDSSWQIDVSLFRFDIKDIYGFPGEEIEITGASHIRGFDRITFRGFEYHAKQIWGLNQLPGIKGIPITGRKRFQDGMLACEFDFGTAFLMPLGQDSEQQRRCRKQLGITV